MTTTTTNDDVSPFLCGGCNGRGFQLLYCSDDSDDRVAGDCGVCDGARTCVDDVSGHYSAQTCRVARCRFSDATQLRVDGGTLDGVGCYSFDEHSSGWGWIVPQCREAWPVEREGVSWAVDLGRATRVVVVVVHPRCSVGGAL
jgi:hypothetical protein